MSETLIDLNKILLGKCLDRLKELPDNCIESCVSDVPYGLGTKEPTVEKIIAYLQGEELDTGGDFMGKRWAIPSVNVWREVYRVLKPGGYVLSFGSTRTFDLISLGLRAAGFQYRDTIMWLYSSGMPKSHNVGNAIDKMKGAKREVMSPATPEVAEWGGYGTGLKPSWEPIVMFRKPFKGTVSKNVLKYGTGALNIDACRVAHSSEEDYEEHKKQVEAIKAKGGVRGNSWKNASDLSDANDVNPNGRWPANTLLAHHPDCQLLGSKTVKGITGGSVAIRKENSYSKSGGYFSEGRKQTERKGYLDETGKEIVDASACVPECPIALLDSQSGDRPSTLTGRADPNKSHEHPGTEHNPNSTFLGERTYHSNVYADSGGASRFFKQFQAGQSEVRFHYSSKANRRKAGSGEFKVLHPTLKPISLMAYLIRMVTPPGGVVLDPYCGSGSTCHAALLEGYSYIGIELDPEHYQEALRRLEVATKHLKEDNFDESVFEELLGLGAAGND